MTKGGEFAHGSSLGCLFSRQHKLEEALLFSGQFMDALQALVDWLYKVEPQLAEDQPVHGDLDLVMNLMDAHKVRAPFPSSSPRPEWGFVLPKSQRTDTQLVLCCRNACPAFLQWIKRGKKPPKKWEKLQHFWEGDRSGAA